MLQFNCKMCSQPFGPIGERNQPRVIPCGHSFCEICISDRTGPQIQSFQCPICYVRHQSLSVRYPPVNHLYYEMIAEFNDFIKRKDWEQDHNKQDRDSQTEERNQVPLEYKCLYPFCHRLRYENEGVKEVFCSAKCLDLNSQLYA